MESDKYNLSGLFDPERSYLVPFYQRKYVWNQEDQWERLWSDIQEKANERLTPETKPTPHFMGAVVLEPQTRNKLIGVERVHIIDGQQRMTTLQFVMTAARIALLQESVPDALRFLEGCMENTRVKTMKDPAVERFKVWPTASDRGAFKKAMEARSLDDLRKAFPAAMTQSGLLRVHGTHPAPLAAIWYFATEMASWMKKAEVGKEKAAEALVEALLNDFVLIGILLSEDDDAQVIFETLNGHGVELTATDLIRNYVFLRADREEADTEALHKNLWEQYDVDWWKDQERRGRLNRPRLEWFVKSTIEAEMRDEVDQGRIYAEYQRFAMRPGVPSVVSATAQLTLLNEHAGNYRALLGGDERSPIGRFGKRFREWDASTAHSLALAIAQSGASGAEQDQMFAMLASYIVRRAICGLTNKSYNKVFIQVLKNLGTTPLRPDSLRSGLATFNGEATRWPRDPEFARAFLTASIYPGRLENQARLRDVLTVLENGLRSSRSEDPNFTGAGNLDIDHMLPRSHQQYWPLQDGNSASVAEMAAAATPPLPGMTVDARVAEIIGREQVIPTFGNLTLLHYGTNRAASNHGFEAKKALFLAHTNLHLNAEFARLTKWNTAAIQERGRKLLEVATKVWVTP
ncbi:MAG TPA: DUF262 domain-containing protein [Verrucomicrobiae bacterium]|nr:DUF262 domain-containing protein [Verrucomicrobiae bacterium]